MPSTYLTIIYNLILYIKNTNLLILNIIIPNTLILAFRTHLIIISMPNIDNILKFLHKAVQ